MSRHVSIPATGHGLRLVGSHEPSRDRSESPAAEKAARRAVAVENITASTLAPHDVRSIFAVKVATALDGGRAAILPPNRRRELVAAAVEMGLRPFDANLAIAVVQDAARSGEPLSSPSVVGGLKLLREPLPADHSAGRLLGLSIAFAAAILAVLVAWIKFS